MYVPVFEGSNVEMAALPDSFDSKDYTSNLDHLIANILLQAFTTCLTCLTHPIWTKDITNTITGCFNPLNYKISTN